MAKSELQKRTKPELVALLQQRDVDLGEKASELAKVEAKVVQLRATLDLFKEKAASTSNLAELYQQIVIKHADTEKQLHKCRSRLKAALASGTSASQPPKALPDGLSSAAREAGTCEKPVGMHGETLAAPNTSVGPSSRAARSGLSACSTAPAEEPPNREVLHLQQELQAEREKTRNAVQQLQRERQQAEEAAQQLLEERGRAAQMAKELSNERATQTVAESRVRRQAQVQPDVALEMEQRLSRMQSDMDQAQQQLQQTRQQSEEAARQLLEEQGRAAQMAKQLSVERAARTEAERHVNGQAQAQPDVALEMGQRLSRLQDELSQAQQQVERERQQSEEAARQMLVERGKAQQVAKQLSDERAARTEAESRVRRQAQAQPDVALEMEQRLSRMQSDMDQAQQQLQQTRQQSEEAARQLLAEQGRAAQMAKQLSVERAARTEAERCVRGQAQAQPDVALAIEQRLSCMQNELDQARAANDELRLKADAAVKELQRMEGQLHQAQLAGRRQLEAAHASNREALADLGRSAEEARQLRGGADARKAEALVLAGQVAEEKRRMEQQLRVSSSACARAQEQEHRAEQARARAVDKAAESAAKTETLQAHVRDLEQQRRPGRLDMQRPASAQGDAARNQPQAAPLLVPAAEVRQGSWDGGGGGRSEWRTVERRVEEQQRTITQLCSEISKFRNVFQSMASLAGGAVIPAEYSCSFGLMGEMPAGLKALASAHQAEGPGRGMRGEQRMALGDVASGGAEPPIRRAGSGSPLESQPEEAAGRRLQRCSPDISHVHGHAQYDTAGPAAQQQKSPLPQRRLLPEREVQAGGQQQGDGAPGSLGRRLIQDAACSGRNRNGGAAADIADELRSASGAATRVGDNLSDGCFDDLDQEVDDRDASADDWQGSEGQAYDDWAMDAPEEATLSKRQCLQPASGAPVREHVRAGAALPALSLLPDFLLDLAQGPASTSAVTAGGNVPRPPSEWLCSPPRRKRGRPRKVRPLSEVLMPIAQPASKIQPRVITSVAKQLREALRECVWPVQAVAAAVQNAVLGCAAPRVTLTAAETQSQAGEKRKAAETTGTGWLGWAQPEVELRGTLQGLVSCAFEADASLSATACSPGAGRGGLCAALLPRLQAQVCCIGPKQREGPSAPASVQGLQLLQTERCALASVHAMICKETGNLQGFRSLVIELLDLCMGSSPPAHGSMPTLLAPLYSALSQWHTACYPEPASGAPPALAHATALPAGLTQPEASFSPKDPIALALHCALIQLFRSLVALPQRTPHPAAPACCLSPGTARAPLGPLSSSLSASSLSGSASFGQDERVYVTLAGQALRLLEQASGQEGRQEQGRGHTSTAEAEGSGCGLEEAPWFRDCCRQLLGLVRWSLPFVSPSSPSSAGHLNGPGSPVSGAESRAASAVNLQACMMLRVLSRQAGFAAVYEQIARPLLSWVPELPAEQQPAAIYLLGDLCTCSLNGRIGSGPELRGCLLLAGSLASTLEETENACGGSGRDGSLSDSPFKISLGMQHACASSALLCAAAAASVSTGCEHDAGMIVRRVREWGTYTPVDVSLFSAEALKIFS